MLRKLPVLCLCMFAMTLAPLSAQKNLKKAKKQYDLRAYELAVQNYQKTLQSNPANTEAILGLADSYRMMKDHLSAIKWYEQAIEQEETLDSRHYVHYAHTLKSVGLYDKAKKYYQKLQNADPIVSEHYALSCDFAKNLLEESENFEISLYGANTQASDFGIAFFKDKVVFASFGNTDLNGPETKNFSYIQKTGNQLLIAPSWKEASRGAMKVLRSPMREQFGIGPLSYSREGKLVVFTRNNFSDNSQQIYPDETDLSLYMAMVDEDGDFYEERAFPYNETEYATAFGQFAFDGKALYFASNRPGGHGGFDIYVSYFKKGSWTIPENLGDRINSSGNEITPFFDGEMLYYSSDYHHGLGGFDVFKSKVVSGQWTYPENMGKGANSPGDDYYFVKHPDSGEMYVSSNRLGGRGSDDIYLLKEIQNFDFAEFTSAEPSMNEEEPASPVAVNMMDIEKAEQTMLDKEDEAFDALLADAFDKAEEEEAVVMDVEAESTSEENIDYAKKLAENANVDIDLAGAKLVSVNAVLNLENTATVYFVQLASLSRNSPDLRRYKPVVKYGNLYKVYKPNSTKIRLGYFQQRSEANEILLKVRKMGFSDAFITSSILNPAEMELVASSYDLEDEGTTNVSQNIKPKSQYKVRLASYADPLWFDVESVQDIGQVEQWTKGSWTIFVLSGFSTKAAAEKALKQSKLRGFVDAELVMDNNGELKRITK